MEYKRIFVLLLVGIVILVGMILFIGVDDVLTALTQANKTYVTLAIIVQLTVMCLWDVKWSVLIEGLDIRQSRLSLFAMLLVGLAINNLTPSGRGGGEPVRAYLLSRASGSEFRETFASVMADKLFDTFPFTILAIVAVGYLIFTINLTTSMMAVLFLGIIFSIALLGFVIYVCFNQAIGVKTIRWVFRQLRRFIKRDLDDYERRTIEILLGFQESLEFLMRNRTIFLKAISIAFIVWFLEIMRVYIVFLAFNVNVAIGMVAAVFLISTIVGMIPALPGGVGIVDAMMILVYSMAGITPFVATAATLIERLISYWMVSIMGVVTLPYFGTGILDEVSLESNTES